MMLFKQHFLYLIDYEHWANDVLFGALDRMDDEARRSPQPLYFGSMHGNLDHLAFFYRKWFARLRGEAVPVSYHEMLHPDWRELKHEMRISMRTMQRWLQQQPEGFFEGRIHYRRNQNGEQQSLWVRDALTHLSIYASTERGQISAIGATLGMPLALMSYTLYRAEMGAHLEHLHGLELAPVQPNEKA